VGFLQAGGSISYDAPQLILVLSSDASPDTLSCGLEPNGLLNKGEMLAGRCIDVSVQHENGKASF
jgi:hypothetical protein